MKFPSSPTAILAKRWPWIVALVLIACGYYGSYVRYNIGFRDEGQTVAFLSQRLLNGEVPLKDVVLSYNVLWFYPVVALYKIFGVSYVLLRGWCFALSTLTAVLGFLLVEKTTRRPWLAFLIALVLVLIPGSTFKNYIPLLAVANTLCLLHVALAPPGSRAALWKTLIGGVMLGLAFLIRIDIAMIFAALWLGLLLLRTLFGEQPFALRARSGLASMALLVTTAGAVHVPFVIDAQRRGFGAEFAGQYLEKGRMFTGPVAQLFKRSPAAPATKPAPSAKPKPAPVGAPATPRATPPDKTILKRASLARLDRDDRLGSGAFLILTYAPLAGILCCVGCGAFLFLRDLRAGGEGQRRGLAILILMGGALATFPQFFFFRPDIPHLSEFMPGYLTASCAALGLLWAIGGAARWWRVLLTIFLVAHTALYFVRVLPERWAGTWTVRKKRPMLFTAENGVNVFVSSRDFAGLTAMQKLLRDFAPNPTDYIVCFPYSPGINLLANRPTYERDVYVDNVLSGGRWEREAIARLQRFQPAAIVLSDWDINGTHASRFSVWATAAKTWIQTHYVHQGTCLVGSDAFEIYTRTATPPKTAPEL